MLAYWKFAAPNPILEKEAEQFLQLWEAQANFEIQSSGTTGTPQIFRFSHRQMLHSAKASIAALELNTQTKALLCLPTNSVGAKMLMARSLVGTFELILQQPSSRPLQYLEQAVNFIAMVPTQLQQSLLHDLEQLKRIQKILVGGGELTPALKAACRAAGLHVWQSYGMTETLSHVALQQISPTEVPHYSALPGIQFSTKNDCLVIHYPQMQFQALYTKDLVTLHSATSFTWLGRADNAINSGGFKIIPELLEQKLAGHFQNPFFTIGIPDEKWGQVVGIIFEGEVAKDYLHFDGLELSSAEIPKKYACIQVFKRTNTHKIQRKEILQSLSNADWKSI
jgi:O-succinylbenzoic acid--CoA ligase